MSYARAVDCLFCRIARQEMAADVVSTDDETIVFRDINPQAPLHLLAIPRRHVASAADLSEEHGALLASLFTALRAAAEAQGVRSYRVVTNVGPDAGQSVEHLHLHLLGGRRLGWPPG